MPRRPPADAPPTSASMPRAEYLARALEDAESLYRAALARGSWNAAAVALRLAVNVRAELDAASREGVSLQSDLSDAELLEVIRSSIAVLPEQLLEQLEDAVSMRRHGVSGPALRVLPGRA